MKKEYKEIFDQIKPSEEEKTKLLEELKDYNRQFETEKEK